MLKPRLMALLPVKDGVVVQSIGFKHYFPVGSPQVAVEFLNAWGVDEIAYLDITATRDRRGPDDAAIRACARFALVPLTVGGGIHAVRDIEQAIFSGADKVSMNTAVLRDPQLLSEGAKRFGEQCMVASIDAVRLPDGGWEARIESGRLPTGLTPAELARRAVDAGAGEILLNSIDRDGAKTGYDLELVRTVAEAVSVPVIAGGGVGHPAHLLAGVEAGASAVAAGNFLHFSEHAVITAKSYLAAHGCPIRLETYASYANRCFDALGRPDKLPDIELENMRFDYIPEEVI